MFRKTCSPPQAPGQNSGGSLLDFQPHRWWHLGRGLPNLHSELTAAGVQTVGTNQAINSRRKIYAAMEIRERKWRFLRCINSVEGNYFFCSENTNIRNKVRSLCKKVKSGIIRHYWRYLRECLYVTVSIEMCMWIYICIHI